MTNPNGYDSNFREERILSEEETLLFGNKDYTLATKDINRDFPYMVKNDKCMETIGARLVNELYISHIFSLALTLHGGTESLTYPYGAPNHIAFQNGKQISTEAPDFQAASSNKTLKILFRHCFKFFS